MHFFQPSFSPMTPALFTHKLTTFVLKNSVDSCQSLDTEVAKVTLRLVETGYDVTFEI